MLELGMSVEPAVEPYYNAAYHQMGKEMPGPGRCEMVSSEVQKLLNGYESKGNLTMHSNQV